MKYKITLVLLLTMVILISFPITASANSAEPPCFTVITMNPPSDLSLSLQFSETKSVSPIVLSRENKAWETYYRFFYNTYPGRHESIEGAALLVEYNGESFRCDLPWDSFDTHNNIVTLNLDTKSITIGQPAWRNPSLVAMRVALTLLIEGFVFFLFGYRSKKSWIAFLTINLITQGVLNALSTGPTITPYWMFGFILMEIIIFGVEMIFFAFMTKEHSKKRALVYALSANTASLLLGGTLISYLPI